MTYLSLQYAALVILLLLIYYILPVKMRWGALLLGNALFLLYFYRSGCLIMAATVTAAYIFGIVQDRVNNRTIGVRKIVLAIAIILVIVPWFIPRIYQLIFSSMVDSSHPVSFILPVGISFYTLQLIAYLADIYTDKIKPQKNFFKFALFCTFFPQIIQGPIPRYDKLAGQLYEGHRFDRSNIRIGAYLIIWGAFLKFMIADKAGCYVDTVFGSFPEYQGAYVWVAMILYSIQLYADFMACTTISIGVSRLFGIGMIDNFARPYLALSVSEFWHRWHISLSTWLRDYVYIPLGGNRKGKVRKYINLMLTFLVSGFWHGVGLNYIVWGLVHGFYQVIGDAGQRTKASVTTWLERTCGNKFSKGLQWAVTFLMVSFAWVIFRAPDLASGLHMIGSMFSTFNPWILFNDQIFKLGIDGREAVVLSLSIIVLVIVSLKREHGHDLILGLAERNIVLRWGTLIICIIAIVIFGTYGYGYEAQGFIYVGF